MKYRNPRHCPFVEQPFDDCFVNEVNSQNIGRVLYFCGGHFEECDIFRQRTMSNRERLSAENNAWGLTGTDVSPNRTKVIREINMPRTTRSVIHGVTGLTCLLPVRHRLPDLSRAK